MNSSNSESGNVSIFGCNNNDSNTNNSNISNNSSDSNNNNNSNSNNNNNSKCSSVGIQYEGRARLFTNRA